VELLIQELVVLVQRSEEYTGFMAAHIIKAPQMLGRALSSTLVSLLLPLTRFLRSFASC
jgi:hypothetical protein